MPPAALTVVILACASLVLTACGRSETPTEPRPEPRPATSVLEEQPPQDIEELISRDAAGAFSFEAYAYDCNGSQVTVRPGDGELTLITPDRELVLPQVEAASGARYAADDDAFWGKGINSAVMTLDGEDTPCELNRSDTPWVDARARGALFRGFGQEPGWNLEIHPERIVMVYQYGQRRVVAPNPGGADDPEQPIRRWHATTESNDLAIEVEDRPCTDVMSGDGFPAIVSVKLDGRAYAGCGRDLH
jgi:membrane-bound inhibitor of C-type lysozyme/uncharacterized membrane protein